MEELKEQLDALHKRFDSVDFIAKDPVSVPHLFKEQKDIEIAGLLSATIAWGKREMIVKNAHSIVTRMDNDPYNFVMNAQEQDLEQLDGFVHRTFNHFDLRYFVNSLKNIYTKHNTLGNFFERNYLEHNDIRITLSDFRKEFLTESALPRTTRHLSAIDKNSACKRLNMFLRWMVRTGSEVDFGLWSKIPSSALYIPLDVHTSNVGRSLGLLTRKQNDWKAVEELTEALRQMDPKDPIKYDYALFSVGIEKL